MPRGHFEHVSVILASLSWDMAAIYLIRSCEADGHVEGQPEERTKEDLEQKLTCWEGIAGRGGCVRSLLYAWVLSSVYFHFSNESPAWI